MEPIEIAQSFALAAWPLWLVLLALAVVRLASRFGYMAPDEYEEVPPCGCSFGKCCGFCPGCCLEAREADEANRAHLLSADFCCGEVEIGNPACPGCPVRAAKYHGDNSWGR